jgi:hypothetical protein
MNSTQRQIDILKGETLALQLIVGQLSQAIANSSPSGAATVRLAFDEAANHAEQVAIVYGKTASPNHTVAALRIVESMRAAVLRNHVSIPLSSCRQTATETATGLQDTRRNWAARLRTVLRIFPVKSEPLRARRHTLDAPHRLS